MGKILKKNVIKTDITVQQLADLMMGKFGEIKEYVGERFARVDIRIDGIDNKLESLKQKVDNLDQKVEILDRKTVILDQKVTDLDQKVEILDRKTVILDQKIENQGQDLREYIEDNTVIIIKHFTVFKREVEESLR